MPAFEPGKIRNVAVVGHRGTGKTSLVEALLFQAGETNRLGTIDAGSTVADWDDDEQQRRMSISLALTHAEWQGRKLNLIDVPGDPSFQGEARCALRVVEGALFVLSGVMGVEVGTARVWKRAEELGIGHVATAAPAGSRNGNRFMARLSLGPLAVVRVASTHAVRAKLTALAPRAKRSNTGRPVGQVLAARRSLRHTPDLLPILKQAGVVDSGGQGLVYLLEGMLRGATGTLAVGTVRAVETESAPVDWQNALEPEDEGYGYDVQFRMHGANLNVESVRHAIEDIGWSAVVVGNDRLIKVHVHVHDPGKPISYAIGLGVEIDDVVVENMQMQYHAFVRDRTERESPVELPPDAVAVIAAVPGVGLRQLFQQDLGAARVISGGQTMNPSAGEFLDAIHALPNEHIVLLPNNKNVILAAQQAANMAQGKQVRVVPSRSVPQGITALLALCNSPECVDADSAAAAMGAALDQVVSAEITTATRSVEIGGVHVREGHLIGLLEGNLVIAGDDMETVMGDLLRKAEADKHELVTLYYGNDTHRAKAQALVEALSADFPAQTFDIVYGGQALYPYIISLE